MRQRLSRSFVHVARHDSLVDGKEYNILQSPKLIANAIKLWLRSPRSNHFTGRENCAARLRPQATITWTTWIFAKPLFWRCLERSSRLLTSPGELKTIPKYYDNKLLLQIVDSRGVLIMWHFGRVPLMYIPRRCGRLATSVSVTHSRHLNRSLWPGWLLGACQI